MRKRRRSGLGRRRWMARGEGEVRLGGGRDEQRRTGVEVEVKEGKALRRGGARPEPMTVSAPLRAQVGWTLPACLPACLPDCLCSPLLARRVGTSGTTTSTSASNLGLSEQPLQDQSVRPSPPWLIRYGVREYGQYLQEARVGSRCIQCTLGRRPQAPTSGCNYRAHVYGLPYPPLRPPGLFNKVPDSGRNDCKPQRLLLGFRFAATAA